MHPHTPKRLSVALASVAVVFSGVAVSTGASQAAPLTLPTACTGNLEVLSANGGSLGFARFAGAYYDVVADRATASTVRARAGDQQNLEDLAAPAGTKFVGLVSGNNGATLDRGTPGYVWLARSAATDAGATPQAVPHTSLFGSRGLSETAVWHFDPASGAIEPSWVNASGSGSSPAPDVSLFQYSLTPHLGATSDLASWNSQSAGGLPVTLRLALDANGCRSPQTVTFTSTAPATAYVGRSYSALATSDSGKDVALNSLTPSVCTEDQGTFAFIAAGTCTVAADQAGDTTYAAATRVTQNITVQRIPATVTVVPDGTVYSGQATSLFARVVKAPGTPGGLPEGTVQFSVDGDPLGTPVPVDTSANPGGFARASSTSFSPHAGGHPVTATFVPTDATTYAGSTSNSTLSVAKAATRTTVAVTPQQLVATVTSQSADTAAATGTVVFRVADDEVGRADVVNGKAVLDRALAAGQGYSVSAEYLGDSETLGSSDSTLRNDPFLDATETSAEPKSAAGWYRTPVTIDYACESGGADLVGECPANDVVDEEGADQSVTRTIHAVDGGIASVTSTVSLDRTAPTVALKGVKGGQRYFAKAPTATCLGADLLSGIDSCTVKTTNGPNGVRTVTATATDNAGNTARSSASYVVVKQAVAGAAYRNGAWEVRRGRGYTVQTQSTTRPTYRLASSSTAKLAKAGTRTMVRTGKDSWAYGATMNMPRTASGIWYLGVQTGRTITPIKIRMVG